MISKRCYKVSDAKDDGPKQRCIYGSSNDTAGQPMSRLGAEKLSGNSFSQLKAKFETNAKSSN